MLQLAVIFRRHHQDVHVLAGPKRKRDEEEYEDEDDEDDEDDE